MEVSLSSRTALRALVLSGQALVLALGVVAAAEGRQAPSVTSTGLAQGLPAGYVGGHYSFWSVLSVHSTFRASRAEVEVNGAGCRGDLRLLSRADTRRLAGETRLTGVSNGALPGVPLAGQTITPALGGRVAVLITSSRTGRCDVTAIRLARRSGFADAWTSLPTQLYVYVAYAHGVDPRARN